jgi:molybdate transport system substrate-binding protein
VTPARRGRRRRRLALVALVLVTAGCGGARPDTRPDARPGGPGDTGEPGSRLSGTLLVLAASSLAESFTELGRRFEAEHPGLSVAFSFAASSSLARQVTEGAPGDVLATADEVSIRRAVDAGAVGSPTVFARNRLAIVTRPGNPEALTGLADLARSGLVVVLCAVEVPCGRLAAEALAGAGVRVQPASVEENVKAVLAKVALGEADAGIVYVTDVRAGGDRVTGVEIPDSLNRVADYPVAVTTSSARREAAAAWVDFVLGPAGRGVLARHGFQPATP